MEYGDEVNFFLIFVTETHLVARKSQLAQDRKAHFLD